MGELGVLFNPGMRHEQEEKLAKQMLREDEGTGRKGRLGIDLESGVVVIGSGTARSDGAPTQATGSQTPKSDQSQSAARPVTDDAVATDRPAPAAHDRGRAVQHSPAAVPSGKARRRLEPDTARQKPAGKSRRRGR